MVLSQIQADCYRRLGFGTSPGTEVVARILGFINAVHKDVMSDPVMTKLRRRTVAFSTVADSPTAVLPQAAVRIYNIVDRTNQRPLDDLGNTDLIRNLDPGRDVVTTTPEGFAVVGYAEAVAYQPSDSSQLLVKSSDAADTTQTAYIEVIDSDGYIRQSSVTLTGTTAVNLGPSDAISVIDLYLSAAPAGEVTLHEDTGVGTELAKIGIGKTRARYTMVEIYPLPSDVVVLHADIDVFITDLANPNDEPFIPDEFMEGLIQKVRAREWAIREKPTLERIAEAQGEKIIGKLRYQMHRRSANPVTPHGQIRRSQLGPYFPPGS